MNPIYYQNQINKFEKDIADLQKKIADESKKENDKGRQIGQANNAAIHCVIPLLLLTTAKLFDNNLFFLSLSLILSHYHIFTLTVTQ